MTRKNHSLRVYFPLTKQWKRDPLWESTKDVHRSMLKPLYQLPRSSMGIHTLTMNAIEEIPFFFIVSNRADDLPDIVFNSKNNTYNFAGNVFKHMQDIVKCFSSYNPWQKAYYLTCVDRSNKSLKGLQYNLDHIDRQHMVLLAIHSNNISQFMPCLNIYLASDTIFYSFALISRIETKEKKVTISEIKAKAKNDVYVVHLDEACIWTHSHIVDALRISLPNEPEYFYLIPSSEIIQHKHLPILQWRGKPTLSLNNPRNLLARDYWTDKYIVHTKSDHTQDIYDWLKL